MNPKKAQLLGQRVLLNLLKDPNRFIRESIELVGVHSFLDSFAKLWLLGPRLKRRLIEDYMGGEG